MLSINIGYPTRSEEREIVMATTQTVKKEIQPVLQGRDVLWIQQLVRQVPASQHMIDYAVDLVCATRPKEPPSPDFVKNWLAWGAGPRAAQNITLAAKARAILHGRFAVTAEDVRKVTYPVLRHRIFTNFNADAEGVDVDQVIEKLPADDSRADLWRGDRRARTSCRGVLAGRSARWGGKGRRAAGSRPPACAASPPPAPAAPSGPPRAAPPPGR